MHHPHPLPAPLQRTLFMGLLLLAGCSTLPAEPPQGVSANAESGRATLVGPIDWSKVHRLRDLVQGKKIKVLEVDSRGGDNEAAMALGYWLHDEKINLEVSRLCLGSCANYLFPAANKKLIAPGAIVAWQGNLHYQLLQQEQPELFAQHAAPLGNSELIRLRQQSSVEQIFFKRIGVDERVCWIGKLPPYNAPGAFVLPPEDLRRFHIKEVRTEIDYSARSAARWSQAFQVQKVVLPYGGAI
ncbi:MAG: hypothetical protein ACRCRW_13130 [Aeromonadaceae bacterium]